MSAVTTKVTDPVGRRRAGSLAWHLGALLILAVIPTRWSG